MVYEKEMTIFLGGQWLDGLVYNRLQAALTRFSNSKNFEIVCGLAFSMRNADIGEFDVAIVISGQLHVIECKTGRISGEGEPAVRILRQAADVRALLGQHGQYFIVNPRITRDVLTNDKSEFLDRCTRQGARLFHGPSAIDNAVADVVTLVEAS